MIDRTRLLNLIPVPRWLRIPGVVRELRNDDGSLYLRRFYLTPCRYLHQIADADGDRHLHNHPWTWAESFILFGGYFEQRKTGGEWRLADDWVSLKADTYHRIAIVMPGTWTYFRHGAPVPGGGWGFLVNGEHVDWKEYAETSATA